MDDSKQSMQSVDSASLPSRLCMHPVLLIMASLKSEFNVSFWSFLIIAVGSFGCIMAGYLALRFPVEKIARLALILSCASCLIAPIIFTYGSAELFLAFLKMFVGKVSGDFVNVFFLVNLQKGIQQITSSNLSAGDTSTVALVDTIENTGNNCDSVLFLELRVIA